MGSKDNCSADRGHSRITGGIILTGIGLVFLLGNLNIIPPIGDSWPLLLVVVGGALLFGGIRDRKKSVPPDASTDDGVPPA